jgi:uncharacterized protein
MLRVTNASRNLILADRLRLARTFFARLVGVLVRPLEPGEAMQLAPCRAVHSFFMRVPIDVVFLDARLRVLETARLAPWRTSGTCSGACSVLELPIGTLTRSGTCAGDVLIFEPPSPA